ncbi:MAG: macro domain-containing protein [Clostridiaceae bacterium]|jgi:O-acetyl-ADP-ribose deacetylase (regulator of RNase III)|nr:macro domain-containing protein [Clostridiaceae bacterium]
MPLRIVRNDITKMQTDAIVNAANSELRMGGGVCGAIFEAAGAEQLQQECRRIGYCNTGEAVITGGYGLPAKHIIHAVGPVWQGGDHDEAGLLYNCYTNSLKLALKHGCESIAFPLISSGIYGYPKDQALHIAISAIGEFLLKHDMDVYLVVFDRKAYTLSEKLFTAIERYIDDNYAREHLKAERFRDLPSQVSEPMRPASSRDAAMPHAPDKMNRVYKPLAADKSFDADEAYAIEESYEKEPYESEKIYSEASFASKEQGHRRSLEDIVGNLDETFSQMVLRLIDEKGMTDVDTYKRANMDRRLFSKIRSNTEYKPSKTTAIALSIALRLSLDETIDLLSRAGYTLSHSSKFDVIIEYFIREGNYNIFEINEALFAFDQDLLGA